MDSLEFLLQHPSSPLARVDVKKTLNAGILERLQIDALDLLIKHLPPGDLTFIRIRPDSRRDAKPEIIIPESIQQVIELGQDDWCRPHISSRVFENTDFRSAFEDFMILLSEGYYQPEEDDIFEAPPTQADSKRKRKPKNGIGEDENGFKDDNYEHYWGERLSKSVKKPRGRARKQ